MKELIVLLVIICVPAAIGLYLFIKPRLVQSRRARLRGQPLPHGVEEILQRNIGLYSLLPDELQQQLHGHVNVFLDEKRYNQRQRPG